MAGSKRGFTLIELMIVVAIIGILSVLTVPRFASLMRKSQEGCTRGNLGTLRSALSIYYGDNEGQYPTDALMSLTIGKKYLDRIPIKYTPPYHSPGDSVDAGPSAMMTDAHAPWFYFSDPQDPFYGRIIVNCVHIDMKGNVWSSY